jgi:hypothetical protein
MSRFVVVFFASFCAVSLNQSAAAVTPFVETHYHQYQSGAPLGLFEATSTTYVDIPGTTKTVTAPAGPAVITWTAGRIAANYALIRPVIGTQAPNATPIYHHPSSSDGNLSGSWSANIAGGTLAVKLQAALSPDFPTQSTFSCEPDFGTSWTLMVFPSAEGAPAMSAVGLFVLVVLMLGAGATVILSRRGHAPATEA